MTKIIKFLIVFFLAIPLFVFASVNEVGTPPLYTIGEAEWYVFEKLNEFRVNNTIPALIWDDRIAQAARGHSQNMRDQDFFDHVAPDGTNPADRLFTTGFPEAEVLGVGENITMTVNFKNALDKAVDNWLLSDAHRTSLLDPKWKLAGMGITQSFDLQKVVFTQVFVQHERPDFFVPVTTYIDQYRDVVETPTSMVTPSPVATIRPRPQDYGLVEGEVISSYSNDGDLDVYIVNEHGFKRLFLNEAIFGFYGHLGFEKVKNVSSATRDAFETSGLFRNCEASDGKVYGVEITGEDTGTLHHVALTGEQALSQDAEFFQKVFCINGNEFNWYNKSPIAYSSLSEVPDYRR